MGERPLVVYLDMNAWIALFRGASRAGSDWGQLHELLLQGVRSGKLIVPLSQWHYLELWHGRDRQARENIGTMMRDLSGYATLMSLGEIRASEIRSLVDRHADSASAMTANRVLGVGVCHAFGSPFGRFRFVESIASPDGVVAEGAPAPAPEAFMTLPRHGPKWEWFNLVGTPEVVANVGLERRPEHRLGTAAVADELEIQELLRDHRMLRDRLRDLLVAQEIAGLTAEINRACWAARVQPHGLFLENPVRRSPAEAMKAAVLELPSVDVKVTLREWQHKSASTRWGQHDRVDINLLSSAVAYADVVVTERRWTHISRASGLAERHQTEVYALRDVAGLLARFS